MTSASTGERRYAGASAAERAAERRRRFLEAGLELMGTRGLAGASVRGVSEESGLAARYFYESFRTVEDLHLAVFEEIAAEALDRALGALAGAADGDEQRTRAVLGEMVDLLLDDPRKGRIVLLESVASPVLGPRVLAESRRFAGLLAATAAESTGADATPSPRLRLIAQFLIGGVAHTLAAVLHEEVAPDREDLLDTLVALFLTVHRGQVVPASPR